MPKKAIVELDQLNPPISSTAVMAISDTDIVEYPEQAFKVTVEALGTALFNAIDFPLYIKTMSIDPGDATTSIGTISWYYSYEYVLTETEDYDNINLYDQVYLSDTWVYVVAKPGYPYMKMSQIITSISGISFQWIVSALQVNSSEPQLSSLMGYSGFVTPNIHAERAIINRLDCPADKDKIDGYSKARFDEGVSVGRPGEDPAAGQLLTADVEASEIFCPSISAQKITSSPTQEDAILIDSSGLLAFPGLASGSYHNSIPISITGTGLKSLLFPIALLENRTAIDAAPYGGNSIRIYSEGYFSIVFNTVLHMVGVVGDYESIILKLAIIKGGTTYYYFVKRQIFRGAGGFFDWAASGSASLYVPPGQSGNYAVYLQLEKYVSVDIVQTVEETTLSVYQQTGEF